MVYYLLFDTVETLKFETGSDESHWWEEEWTLMKSTILNYAQEKEHVLGCLAVDYIGSVMDQCARKWDRDNKQIQIAATASEVEADQLCKLNIATGLASAHNKKRRVRSNIKKRSHDAKVS